MKRPSFQFYPGDWLRNTKLRACSIEARGLAIDMMCFMHQGDPYGHLKVNDVVILDVNLASMVGLTLDEFKRLSDELEKFGVFKRDESGCIYSPRMIRDEDVRNKRAAGGDLGGNPLLMKNKSKSKTVKDNLKGKHKVNLTTEVEEEVEDSKSNNTMPGLKMKFKSPEFLIEWQKWIKHRKEKKKPYKSIEQMQNAIDALEKFDEQFATEHLNRCRTNDYQGLIFSDTQNQYEKWKSNKNKNIKPKATFEDHDYQQGFRKDT